jgi:hypothetical protein
MSGTLLSEAAQGFAGHQPRHDVLAALHGGALGLAKIGPLRIGHVEHASAHVGWLFAFAANDDRGAIGSVRTAFMPFARWVVFIDQRIDIETLDGCPSFAPTGFLTTLRLFPPHPRFYFVLLEKHGA